MPYGFTHPNGQTRKPIHLFLTNKNGMRFFYIVWIISIVNLFMRCMFICLQLQWSLHPVCFLPESLRGIEISDLKIGSLEVCTAADSLHDETFDAASTSHNFLTRGKQLFCFSLILFYETHSHA